VTPVIVALTTAPDSETAERIAQTLVGERLVACANLAPLQASIFRWEGKICRETEVLLILKTTTNRIPDIQRRLPQIHPYEVPELIVLRATDGLDAYLDWVQRETQ
jgi:periplasmic divalent cation tolerance protein